MKTRTIGDVTVSAIGLGGMPLSIEGRPDEKQGIATIHAALEQGITLIDTADAYHQPGTHEVGHNELLVAKAVASFHGGGLVTDKPDSPHLLIPKMKARFLIAIAANDDAKQPEAKDKLKEAFAQASLPASVEVFEGTKHGWCPPDSHVYDATAAEKAWSELLALFKTAMK